MAERLTELIVPIPFDLNEELTFLDRKGDVCHETVRQILLGKGNAHTTWISKKFVCRCRVSSSSLEEEEAHFILDRGTETNLRNAEIAVKALIEAASELIDTLQATENRILNLSNDVSFIRWYERESSPESRESRRSIISQICSALREEQEQQEQ